MEQQLQFIEDFANTIANTFKQFAQLCRAHLRKSQNSQSQFKDLQQQLIDQRKKRIELQEKIRQKLSGIHNSGQPLLPPNQQRKRPKNPFTLYVADQRVKILQQHPNWDLQKVTQLAAIKWKKMSEQQKMGYQRKFEELSKLYEQQANMARNAPGQTNQNTAVKRQFREDDEGNKKHLENELQNQTQNAQRQLQVDQHVMEHQEQTLMMNNDNIQQQTMNMEVVEKPQGHINQILDLFHTPANKSLQNDKPAEEEAKEANLQNKNVQSGYQPEVNNFREALNIEPSIQIIQQIVIEPTAQDGQK